MSVLRNQFIKETGLKLKTEHKHYCEQCADEVLFDAWNDEYVFWLEKKLANEDKTESEKVLPLPVVSESLRDYMATRFAQTALQTWDSELSNEHREAILEDWINRNGEGLTIQANIAKDAYSLADEMLKHR